MTSVNRVAALTAVGLGGWLGYQLLTQNGRLLLRIEALEERLAQLIAYSPTGDGSWRGLPIGSVVLDFALPTLSGGTMTLSQWQGRRVLLIFFDPRCGYCRRMLPDLAGLEPDPVHGRPVPLVISTGDAEENRRLMDGHGVRCPVLLQERDEVAQMYQVDGTPMGYLLDEQGTTASPLAVGAQALLDLADARPLNGAGAGEQAAGVRLDLGCGSDPRSGWVNHDRTGHAPYVAVAHDLNALPWPWPDASADEISALDVMEHLKLDVQQWLDECWRILRPNRSLYLRVPAWDNPVSYRDPTHRRVFHEETFDYWDRRSSLWLGYGRFYFAESNRWWRVERVERCNPARPEWPGDLCFRLVKDIREAPP